MLGALRTNALYRRPDDYWERVADRYRAMNASELDRAIRGTVDPDDFVYVVVGDAKVVRPQLQSLGLPIEEMRMTPAAAQPQPQPATPVASPAPAPAVPTEGERG